jgi:hypothetical protein
MIAVGSLLVVAFAFSTENLRNQAEIQQLKRIAEYVAAKGCELVSASKANVVYANYTLDIPILVGDKQYWIQLENDSSSAWVETGFGDVSTGTGQQVTLPLQVSASGTYISEYGIPVLQCNISDGNACLELSGGY